MVAQRSSDERQGAAERGSELHFGVYGGTAAEAYRGGIDGQGGSMALVREKKEAGYRGDPLGVTGGGVWLRRGKDQCACLG
ncbi:hypothetical protein E2562_006602 [Oryza meyeriana var. granulata]|uniref:Uncharacterized protein n=1 Tax=Oryza meyeriana var. granulata TaxID=110450 RepID=A0A6G1EI31_9ORYZ|nr:hypothetical protein E2562_006602 [Oryza meyeriana var. granulata]